LKTSVYDPPQTTHAVIDRFLLLPLAVRIPVAVHWVALLGYDSTRVAEVPLVVEV
jgi:hypothetical protein